MFRESLEIFRELADEFDIGMTLANVAFLTRREGDCEAAPLEKAGAVPTSVVAFTDRNDLFTYPLQKEQLHLIGLTGDPLNVIVENGGFTMILPSFPSITDPVKSHTGYQENPSVVKMLACGTVKKKLRECK